MDVLTIMTWHLKVFSYVLEMALPVMLDMRSGVSCFTQKYTIKLSKYLNNKPFYKWEGFYFAVVYVLHNRINFYPKLQYIGYASYFFNLHI